MVATATARPTQLAVLLVMVTALAADAPPGPFVVAGIDWPPPACPAAPTVCLVPRTRPVEPVTGTSARAPTVADVEYGPRPWEQLDVYHPGDDLAAPVAVWLHGGGWIGGDRRPVPDIVDHLLDLGWAVVSPGYRTAAVGAPSFPGVVEDVSASVRWVGEQGQAYGLDPGTVVTVGASAGGHLAVLAALAARRLDPAPATGAVEITAAISLAGIMDLPSFARGSHPWAAALPRVLLGCDGPCPNWLLRLASPTSWVSAESPPTFVVAGTRDELVPVEQAALLAAAYVDRVPPARQARVWIDVVPGAGHNLGGPAVEVAQLARFLDLVRTRAWD